MKDEFYDYLKFEDNKTENTCKSYTYHVEVVREDEGYSWKTLAQNIATVISIYDIGGAKEDLGSMGHRSRINALKRFQEFVHKHPSAIR